MDELECSTGMSDEAFDRMVEVENQAHGKGFCMICQKEFSQDHTILRCVGGLLTEADRVKECLEKLLDLQNGPPLLKYEKQWTAVVKTAEMLLGRRATEPEPPKETL
jgi:hypothetical protein